MAPALSYEAFQQRRHILALDGLRAFAILGVLFHHTRNKPFGLFHGYRGVWVFFVLSGFLITTLALREEARSGRLDIRSFMIRRAFRILPLYYLMLAAYIVWVLVLNGDPDDAPLFHQHLLNFFFYAPEFPIFLHNFQIPFSQTWSLGIEEKFYVVWPFLAFWLLAKSPYRLVATLALIAMTSVLTITSTVLAQMWGSYTDILIGCLVAQLMHKREVYERLAVLGRTGIAWGVVGALAIATVSPWTGTQIGERMYSTVAALALIALVTNQRGPASLLSTPWLVRIGVWSYAIYLTHTIIFEMLIPAFPPGRAWDYATLPVMLLIDLPICWLLHVYVEKPLIHVGKRLAARESAPAMYSRDQTRFSAPLRKRH